MSGNGMKILSVIVVSLLTLAEVSSASRESMKCAWNEYRDDIADDCGPCHEICTGIVNKNAERGTEDQCRSECSEYLASLECTDYQYYDDIVHSCAPCWEICDAHEHTKTTQECSSKCKAYLPTMDKLCKPVKQYFDEEAMKCQECSDLCRFNEPNQTDPACFEKCHAYVETINPVFIDKKQHLPGEFGSTAASKEQSSPSSLHPGIITSIAVCVVGVLAALAFSVYWFHLRPKPYVPAPLNDEETGRIADDQPVDTRNGEQGQDLSFGMKEPGLSIQVSSEGVAQQTTTDEGVLNDVNQELSVPDQEFARPETDPLGPSSAAGEHVLYRNR